MKKLVILHFNDISKYPPALNLIEYLGNKNIFDEIIILSRGKLLNGNSKINFKNSKSYNYSNIIIRFISYLIFYIKCILTLLRDKPIQVIYYESLSFFPVFIYKFFFPAIKIYCHYHEYESINDYKNSMFLNRFNHLLEKKCYSKFQWLSQTNKNRLDLFLNDNAIINLQILHVMPNYPPMSWYSINQKRSLLKSEITNFVYVGALDFEDIYLKEFINWVVAQKGRAKFSLYSNNFRTGVVSFIQSLDSDYIEFKGSVPYSDLPQVLSQYHIGVILYKCKTMNYIYNEPNKFFEYYSSGLDVWFPKEMLAMKPNIEYDYRPSVIEVDYENLKSLDELISKSNDWKQKIYIRENAFVELALALGNN